VTVSRPVLKPIKEYRNFTGRTAAVESVEIRARVSGYLARIPYKSRYENGKEIHRGEEGLEVKKGELLFEIDPRPYEAALAQAEGNLKAALARLQRQDADLARAKVLRDRGAISREEYDKAIGDKGETAGSLVALRAAVARAKLDLDFTRVTAPFAGRVGRAAITEGNLVTADNTLLTTIVSLDPMYAYFDVDESSMLHYQKLIREKKLKSARDAKIPVDLGLSNERGYPHEGIIDYVDNQLNAATGTLRIRGLFSNKDRVLTPNLFVRVRVPFSPEFKALMVSERAIGMDQRGPYVLVVQSDNTVEHRPVKIGTTEDGLTVIEEGLKEDESVIVNGLQRARPGSPVKPMEENAHGNRQHNAAVR
jgi:RND family efflux transporter MFP subunit